MSSAKVTPNPDSCLRLRSYHWRSPTNVDVDGVAVAVANVITSLCLRILVTWSDEDIDQAVQGSLIQTLSILLSTLTSVNRDQLSLFDANFALLLNSSPLTIYLVVATCCELCGVKTGLYKRIKHRRVICVVHAWIPLLWLVLSMLLRLSGTAFINGRYCDTTFGFWLKDIAAFLIVSMQLGNYYFVFVPLFLICLILITCRRWSQVMSRVRPSRGEGLRPWRWFYILWIFVKHMWYIIDHNHKWFIYLVFGYLDASWATYIISGAVTAASGNAYVLSFGQIFSLSAAVPPLASTIRFIHSCRLNLLHFIRRLPDLASTEARYLVLGRKPDTPVQGDRSLVARPNSPPHLSQEPPGELCPERSTKPTDSTADPLEENLTAVVESPRDIATTEHTSPTTVAGNTPMRATFPTVRRLRRSQTCPSLRTGAVTVEGEQAEPSSPPFVV